MASERTHHSAGPAIEGARLLSPTFQDLWPAEATSGFASLLRAIDQAILRQRCLSRLRRMQRMLARA